MTKSKPQFLDHLNQGHIIVADGAMGTQLLDHVEGQQTCVEAFNLDHPELVQNAHAAYIAAGSQMLETNTFGINYHKLKKYHLEDQVADLCHAAVNLAKKAVGAQGTWIAGAVGPLTQKRRELDLYSDTDIETMYLQVMQSLANCGVDLIVLETFTRLSDLEVAVKQAKTLGLPILAQMAFGDHGVTDEGVSVAKFVERMESHEVNALGSNCKMGPHLVSTVVNMQAEKTALPLSVFPNAGYAQHVDGRYVYGASPEYFAQKIQECIKFGAQIIGGCCGTGPEHIAALSQTLKQAKLVRIAPRARKLKTQNAEPVIKRISSRDNPLLHKMKSKQAFVTIEVEPPKDLNLQLTLESIQLLCQSGCDALNIPDNPLSIVRPDHVIFADIVKQHVDIPVILHLTCRDKNLIALRSNILGAMMAQVDSILAVTGDPASLGDHPGASSVYDVQSVGLVELIDNMNQHMNLSPPLSIGVAFNPNVNGELGMQTALAKLHKKINAGANYIETQPVFDQEKLNGLIQHRDELKIPVCIGIMPLLGQKNAEFLHNEVPGMKIPKTVMARLKGLKRKQANAMGLTMAKEIIDQAMDAGFNNFYIIPPMKKYHLAAELVAYIRQRC